MLLRSSSAILSCSFLFALIDDSLSFSVRKSSQLIKSSSRKSSSTTSSSSLFALNIGFGYNDDSEDFATDIYLMNRAQACVDSDSCSLEEAQTFLHGILLQQKECIDGGVLSTKAAICDNINVTADLVANLREKIETERQRRALTKPAVHMFNLMFGIYVVSTIIHGFAAVPNVPVDLPLYTDYSSLEEASSRGVTPFLPQEWFWAVRDGYLPSIMTEWFKNGGLVVDTSAFDTKAVTFTPQEWIWSIQNGSFGNILQENMKYGGLVVDTSFDGTDTIPMTSQEVLWSIRDGYAGTALKHVFRNGGV